MGRGQREGDQALRLSAIPRRLAKPRELEQRRYSVERIKSLSPAGRQDEPGYLTALGRSVASPAYYDRALLAIKEEIAALGADGQLTWIPGHNLRQQTARGYNGVADLRAARWQCDRLNESPLGPLARQDVDGDGNLVISRQRRDISQRGEIFEVDLESKAFDVTSPEQAAAAKSYYQQLDQTVSQEREAIVKAAVQSFNGYSASPSSLIFVDRQAAKRGMAAAELAATIDKDGANAVARAEASKDRAERSKKTINSLAQS